MLCSILSFSLQTFDYSISISNSEEGGILRGHTNEIFGNRWEVEEGQVINLINNLERKVMMEYKRLVLDMHAYIDCHLKSMMQQGNSGSTYNTPYFVGPQFKLVEPEGYIVILEIC